jgi:DNA-binding response OmpR family regulator
MRALIIEDNQRIAGFIAGGLGQAGYATDAAGTLDAASELLAAAQYDIVLLDLGLPDGDGISWLKRVRASGNAVPVLILTARDGLGDRVAGLDTGADDYVVKPFEMDELMARCRALLRRPAEAISPRLTAGDIELDLPSRIVRVGANVADLGKRETDILESLMRRSGKVVTREALDGQIYSFTDEFTPNAIEAAVSRLRRKLAEAGSTATIQTVRGVGYFINAG